MAENSGWIKYAVVGIIVVIAIVAALVLLGVVELPERGGGGGAVGTTSQQQQFNPFFGFIPVAIVAIIALFLVKYLHKRKEPETTPAGDHHPQPPPQEGRVDLEIEPQWANFEFSGSKEQKFTYKVTNRTPKELKEVDVAYQEKDDAKFSIVRNARTQINLIPAGGTAEGEFYIQSTVSAKNWADAGEQTGVHAYVWWRDEAGQPWRTDYAAIGLSWNSPTTVPQTPLKLKIRPVSGSPIGVTFQEGDAAKDVEFEIINEGIDDVKNCELRIAADAAFLNVSNGGVFPISVINGNGGTEKGAFSVKPTVSAGKLSNLVETAFTCVVFKSHGSTEQISNIVSVPVVMVPLPPPVEPVKGIILEVRPTVLYFSVKGKKGRIRIDYALTNDSNADARDCKLYILAQKKANPVCDVVGTTPLIIGNIVKGTSKTGSFEVEANLPNWKGAYPLVAVATFTVDGIRRTSNRIILNASWGAAPKRVAPRARGPQQQPSPSPQLPVIIIKIEKREYSFKEDTTIIEIPYKLQNISSVEVKNCALVVKANPEIYELSAVSGQLPGIYPIDLIPPQLETGRRTFTITSKVPPEKWGELKSVVVSLAVFQEPKEGALPISNVEEIKLSWEIPVEKMLQLELATPQSKIIEFIKDKESGEVKEIAELQAKITNVSEKDVKQCVMRIDPEEPDLCKIYGELEGAEFVLIPIVKAGKAIRRNFKIRSLVPKEKWGEIISTKINCEVRTFTTPVRLISNKEVITAEWKIGEPPIVSTNEILIIGRVREGAPGTRRRRLVKGAQVIAYEDIEERNEIGRFESTQADGRYEIKLTQKRFLDANNFTIYLVAHEGARKTQQPLVITKSQRIYESPDTTDILLTSGVIEKIIKSRQRVKITLGHSYLFESSKKAQETSKRYKHEDLQVPLRMNLNAKPSTFFLWDVKDESEFDYLEEVIQKIKEGGKHILVMTTKDDDIFDNLLVVLAQIKALEIFNKYLHLVDKKLKEVKLGFDRQTGQYRFAY